MKISLVGGDARFLYTERALTLSGHTVFRMANGGLVLNEEALSESDAVILPLPVSRDGVHLYAKESPAPLPLSCILPYIRPMAKLFVGRADKELLPYLTGHPFFEYGSDPIFLRRNSVLSARGALSLLRERGGGELPKGEYALVGNGHLAAALAEALLQNGVRFTAYARRPEGSVGGVRPLPLSALLEGIGECSVLLNTVPAPLYHETMLSGAKRGLLLLELACTKGIVDEAACHRFGIDLLPAPALPLRYAKEEAGEAVASAVLSALF